MDNPVEINRFRNEGNPIRNFREGIIGIIIMEQVYFLEAITKFRSIRRREKRLSRHLLSKEIISSGTRIRKEFVVENEFTFNPAPLRRNITEKSTKTRKLCLFNREIDELGKMREMNPIYIPTVSVEAGDSLTEKKSVR